MSFLNKNNPTWGSTTRVVGPTTVAGGHNEITHRTTVTISNQGPVNMFVTANKDTGSGPPPANNGILMQPGAALTLALNEDAVIQVTPNGAIYNVVYY